MMKNFKEQVETEKKMKNKKEEVDTQFQNYMVRCAYTEMKTLDFQDNNNERVPINKKMYKQPNRGKRKRDDDEHDRKSTATQQNNIPEDDEDNQYDDDHDKQNNTEHEMIK